MKFGNTSVNVEACKKLSREEFVKMLKGKMRGYDINKAYDEIVGKKNVTRKLDKKSDKGK